MLMLSERVKKTTHRTLPGLNAPNWQCQAHWFLTWGGAGGLAVPPVAWARGKMTESVEQAAASGENMVATVPDLPSRPLCFSFLGTGQPNPGQQTTASI